jgi:hypothetical protein
MKLDNIYDRQQTAPKNQCQIPAREIAHENPKMSMDLCPQIFLSDAAVSESSYCEVADQTARHNTIASPKRNNDSLQ